jgi:hypothetical protein
LAWLEFNPPSAPHFVGVFERMKSAEMANGALLGDTATTDDELVVTIIGAEWPINLRLMTYPVQALMT